MSGLEHGLDLTGLRKERSLNFDLSGKAGG